MNLFPRPLVSRTGTSLLQKLFATIAIVTTLAGCATTETGRAPDDGVNPSFSGEYIFDFDRNPQSTTVIPVVLDSIPIKYGMDSRIRKARIYTTPGVHRIVSRVGFHNAVGKGAVYAVIVLEANLLAGHDYLINGKLDGDIATLWLEDARTGKVLPYSNSKRCRGFPEGSITPVILPGR